MQVMGTSTQGSVNMKRRRSPSGAMEGKFQR